MSFRVGGLTGRAAVLMVALTAVLIAALALIPAPASAVSGSPATTDSSTAPALRAQTPVLSARRVMTKVSDDRALDALRADVDKVLKAPENQPWLASGCVSVSVGGQPVAAHQATAAVTPASSLKTVVAFSVLTHFPADHRFRTEVRGQRTGNTVNGPLYLVGGGDPLLETDKAPAPYKPQIAVGHPRTRLEDLADRLVQAGITRVGAVVGDGSAFDGEARNPNWKGSFVPTEVAPIGGLVVNDGRTAPVTRSDGTPAGQAAALFADLLRARGVAVGGASSSGSATGEVLASIDSPSVEEIVGEMMRESDNTTAEMLTKNLGRRITGKPGTTADGAAAIRRTLTEAGLDAGALVQQDGSGLAGGNRVTCDLLRGTLVKAGRDSALARSLPVAGVNGTLVDRMTKTPAQGRLRAKTGTLNGTSALAGWVDPATPGRFPAVAFAAVSNGVPQPLERLGQFGDRLGATMARYPQTFDASAVTPRPPA